MLHRLGSVSLEIVHCTWHLDVSDVVGTSGVDNLFCQPDPNLSVGGWVHQQRRQRHVLPGVGLVSAWCRQALPHSTDRATFSTSCERSSCAPTSRVAPLVHRLEPQRPLGRRTDRFASHGVQPSPNHFIARSLDVRNAHHVEAVDVVVHVASARAQHGIPRQPPRPDTQVTTLMAQKHCCLSRRSDRRDSEHAPHQRPLWRNQSDFFTLHSDVWYIWNKPQIPKAEGTG